jgi:fructose-1,6-bisphosphatase/inositol monophosphatase family enzyme
VSVARFDESGEVHGSRPTPSSTKSANALTVLRLSASPAPHSTPYAATAVPLGRSRRKACSRLHPYPTSCGPCIGYGNRLLPWDIAAGVLIVQEAGGVFEPLLIADDPHVRAAGAEGSRFVRMCSGEVPGGGPGGGLGGGAYIAANGHLLPALREVLGAQDA